MTNHFIELKNLEAVESRKGILLSTVDTQNLTIAYTNLQAGIEIPLHNHPQEAVDIMLEGLLEMQVDAQTETLTQGMIAVVPSNVLHKATAITPCKVVTIFYPQRKF